MAELEKKWYVIRCAGGKEKKAKEYIESEIRALGLNDYVSQILIPTEKIYQVRNGKKVSKESIFFPGYVLIEAHLTGELQHIIRNVPHVSGFLTERQGKDKEPIPLRPSEINRILGIVDEQLEQDEENITPFIVGEAVKITDGPFNGFDGTIEEILQDKKKLKVMVKIFGRKTLLELNFVHAANPSPPVGPALGSKGVNIMDFCKQFNARTQDKAGKVLPVIITVYSDKSFTFVVKQPPVAVQIKEAAKIAKGSAEPNRSKAGSLTWDQVKAIAQDKMPDMNAFTLKSAMKMVAGTARSMGVTVTGTFPEDVK